MIPSPVDISPLLPHVVPFALVLFRLAGIFLMAPLLSSLAVPGRYKALLVAMLSAAVYPLCVSGAAPLRAPQDADVFALVPLIASEALIGFTIGAIASLPLMTLEMGGVIMGQTMGFSLARVYNPEYNTDTDLLGQLLFYVALGVFIALGGLETLVGATIDSFHFVPVGGFNAAATPLDTFLGVLASSFELAIRVSLPVVGIVMLLCVAFGVIGKTMPQVNIMSVGFTVKAFAGLVALTLALVAVRDAAGDKTLDALDTAVGWVKSLSGAATSR